MIFFAFPFLLSFLKRFGYSGICTAFFGASLAAQWAIICSGVFTGLIHGEAHIQVNIQSLCLADYTTAVVLIAYCTTMGYASPTQLIIISFFLPIFYGLLEMVLFHYLLIADAGGSILIHSFGAYYGMAFCRMMYRKDAVDHPKEDASYTSDMFSMAGTLFLWIYWPSFNGVFGAPDYEAQHRIVVNTYLGLLSGTVMVFIVSFLTSKDGKFTMAHIQNATLAGGVAVGTAANMMMYPWGALLVGAMGGTISTLGFVYMSPLLLKYLKINDVAGVNNLHGMPGILGGIAGAVISAHAQPETYGHQGLYSVFSARAPMVNTTEYVQLQEMGVAFTPGSGRTARLQGCYQAAGLAAAIGIALIGGLLTGLVARFRAFNPLKKHQLYDDFDFYVLPDSNESYSAMEFIMSSLGMDDEKKEKTAKQDSNKNKESEEVQLMKDK
ncbi:predicted protein [Nematostella vectensis]|uniref:Ammonia transporter n=1 Tax=Nematostella vectensis TaxID=45351 RepID=A7SJM6_NEMVE|eukprot:XP_001628152.1 predicted protein [Nematostella vectensis]